MTTDTYTNIATVRKGTVSDAIKALQEVLEKYGDIPFTSFDESAGFPSTFYVEVIKGVKYNEKGYEGDGIYDFAVGDEKEGTETICAISYIV